MAKPRCSQCREVEASQAAFCSGCGKPIAQGETPESIAQPDAAGLDGSPSGCCPECVDTGALSACFCVHCGAAMPPADASRAEPAQTAEAPGVAPAGAPPPPASPQTTTTGDAEQAGRKTANWALGLGIATIFLSILGPFALWLGLRSRKHGGGRAAAGIVLGALGTVVLAVSVIAAASMLFGGANGVDRIAGVLDILGTPAEREIVERIPPSTDQGDLIELYGYPTSFVVVDDNGTRGEVWDYQVCTGNDAFINENFEPRRLYFEDGVFVASEPIQAVGADEYPNYHPTEFDLAADEAQIRQIMGRPTEKRELDMAEYGALSVLNYRNEIMFVFRDDKPFGVMTFLQNAQPQETLP